MAKYMQIMGLSLVIMVCLLDVTTANSADDCPNTCGNVDVPYPFGINDISATVVNPTCAMNNFFMFLCNSTEDPPRLYYGNNLPIRDISVEEGTITISTYEAFDCYNESGLTNHYNYWMRLGKGPFRLSDTRNKLTAVGCDTFAFMTDAGLTFGSGCISLCSENKTLEDYCSGIGCCQTAVPRSLKTINITILSASKHKEVWQFNPCGFAFLADERTFNASKLRLDDRPYSDVSKKHPTSDIVIEWVVKEETCEYAQSISNRDGYACGNNTYCTYSQNGMGYRCSCLQGFTGNPYRPQGCQDIDECKEAVKYPCDGTCKNTVGNYTCQCPLGMRGDGKIGCQGFRITTIATIVGAVMFVMIISLLIVIIWRKWVKEKNFLVNGGLLLKHQRVRMFTEKELTKATKNYHRSQFLGEGGFGSVYKGTLADGTHVAVKKPKDLDKTQINHEFQKEIGIVSQVNHVNVVKILGLCLETKLPLLVYEYISNGSLFQHIHQRRSNILTNWKSRLRIAAETALALDYLHSLANPPIIHGDVKSANILIDENYTTKVSDFGASVLISPGQSDMATKIQGTFGYLDPEYLMTGVLTEKSDVYSFGVVLVELLTGKKPNCNSTSGTKSNIIQYFLSSLERNNLPEILCMVVTEDEMEEIKVFAELAKWCLNSSGVNRPSMKEVAEDLSRLRKLNQSVWAQQNSLETEHLLDDKSHCDTISMSTFDMDLYPVDTL
ncbi:wall-associated receptor kinase 2-like [Mercurialis annua]|uniref:wall-associated receptor kinase 2-like n=1 Tax=Mercurialis annua TaxID=3986 RepID=UPI00215E6DB6|nr:wall-associated receptor kinase 2-like [Mercurialis annua]